MIKDCTTVKLLSRLLLLTGVLVIHTDTTLAQQTECEQQTCCKLLLQELNLSQVTRQLKIAQAKQFRLQKWIDGQPVQLEDVRWGINPILAELRAKRQKIEQDLQNGMNKRGQMTESHPKVINWQKQIIEIDELLKTTPEQIIVNKSIRTNEPRLAAERNIQMLLGEIEVLSAELETLTAKVKQIKTANNQTITPSMQRQINKNTQLKTIKMDQLNPAANNITMANDEVVMQERAPGAKEYVVDETCEITEHGVVVDSVVDAVVGGAVLPSRGL